MTSHTALRTVLQVTPILLSQSNSAVCHLDVVKEFTNKMSISEEIYEALDESPAAFPLLVGSR
jgi:hypothetical protein